MLDLSHIPSQQQNTQIFYVTSGSAWQTWQKPRNAKFIEIFCLGAGAGGGHSISNTGQTSGGAGGASGGIVRGLIPAFLLPDNLYIQVGKGGVGVLGSGTGGSGGISYIALQPSTSEQTLVCKSSTTVAGGGSTTAGTAPTISTVSLSAFGNLGLFTAIAGVNGSSAGTNAGTPGANAAALGTTLVTGGAGGGGKQGGTFGTGGNITSASAILTSQVNGGVAAGQDGDSGYGLLQPFCGTGGAGGAARGGTTGQGGKGGNGYFGCGGGGAGGCPAGSTKAGDGGDGLVIITVIT